MIGTVLRVRYEVTQLLGETPIFTILGAKDRLQQREVCIRLLKEPYKDEPEFVERLTEVATRVANVNHPNLERVIGVDGDEAEPFLITELSKGSAMSERLRKLGTLSVPVAVQTAITLCEAIHSLHKAGIVHGDLGAHHLMMSADGESKVQMGGIWAAYSFAQTAGHAVMPQMAPYMAPEITQGSMPSPASDVYAIGVMLYEMLAGRQPFLADTPVGVAVKHLNEAPPNVRMMNPSAPIVLAEIVKKTMAKDPHARYRDAGDLLSDLRIMQDALRFGRMLAWPIRDDGRGSAPVAEDPIVAPAQPVAPKMSAARDEKKEKVKREPKPSGRREAAQRELVEEKARDVPVWLSTLIAFFAGLFAIMVLIFVVFNLNKPKQVAVPDLKRLSYSEAATRLEDLSLKPRVHKRETSESIPAEQILRTQPDAGEKVYEGTVVQIVVSAGSSNVVVPDLNGVTLDQARKILATAGLDASDDIERVDSQKAKDTVVGQDPAKGAKAMRNSAVRLKVSIGKLSRAEQEANNRRSSFTINIELSELTTNIRLRVDMTDARGKRTIYEREQEPGDVIDPIIRTGYGKEAKFEIYYDDELVKTVTQPAAEAEPVDEDR